MNRKKLTPWSWVPTLYFAQGLPYVAVMTLSVIMYKRLGLDNASVALYTGWLYLPWVVKPLWSPVVDIFSTKRSWTVAMQLAMAVAFASVAFAVVGAPGIVGLSLAGFALLAFLSATHDIASDGFYMLALDEHGQSMFVGIRSAFYRLATVVGQGVMVVIAGLVEESTGDIPMAWSVTMGALSLMFVLAGIYHYLILPLPSSDHPERRQQANNDFWRQFLATFTSFFAKKDIATILAFILLYRLPEALLVKLINPFLLDPASAGGMGLTTAQVGIVYGTLGIAGLTLGGIVGGFIVSRLGLGRCLHPLAWCMSLTCAAFLYMSFFNSSTPLWLVTALVFIEQLGYGLGFTAFVLCLIRFSQGPESTSHYALCTGFMAAGMMLPGMAAGYLQQCLGYQGFFILTMACCAATIGVCYLIRVPRDFGRRKREP